jgi:hypothetical protein
MQICSKWAKVDKLRGSKAGWGYLLNLVKFLHSFSLIECATESSRGPQTSSNGMGPYKPDKTSSPARPQNTPKWPKMRPKHEYCNILNARAGYWNHRRTTEFVKFLTKMPLTSWHPKTWMLYRKPRLIGTPKIIDAKTPQNDQKMVPKHDISPPRDTQKHEHCTHKPL